jgi:hypothetical protein
VRLLQQQEVGCVVQVVESLPSKYKALTLNASNPAIPPKKQYKEI